MLFLRGMSTLIPEGPGLRSQVLEIGPASAVAQPFTNGTKIIRVYTDAAIAIAFGANPIASPACARMSANSVELFGVNVGDKMAAMELSNQAQGDGTFALLQVIADPKAAQTRMAELNAATSASTKAAADAKSALAELDRAKADLAKREAVLAQQAEAIATKRENLDASTAKLAADQKALEARTIVAETENKQAIDLKQQLAAQSTELTARERAATLRAKQVSGREEALKVAEASYSQRVAKLKELAG
jgi:hypothetical protein